MYLHKRKYQHLVQRCCGILRGCVCVCVRFWSSSWACKLAGEGTLGFLELERALHWFIVNSFSCGFHGFRKRPRKGRLIWSKTLENGEACIRVCFAFVLGTCFLCFKFISCFCEVQQEYYRSDKLPGMFCPLWVSDFVCLLLQDSLQYSPVVAFVFQMLG